MTTETTKALHELKLPGMACGWEALAETHQLDKLTLRDGIQLLLQAEFDSRQASRINRLIHQARFRQRATIEQLDTDVTRGVPAALVAELATGQYIENGMSILITGPAGTGKSFLAQALGERACRQGKKTMYFTMNMLIENLKLVRLEGRATNFFRKLAAADLLIIDDFGMKRLEGDLQNDFEQIVDDRYGDKALIIVGQLPVADWYDVFKNELIAEACMDRLVHKKSIRFELKGDSLRKKY